MKRKRFDNDTKPPKKKRKEEMIDLMFDSEDEDPNEASPGQEQLQLFESSEEDDNNDIESLEEDKYVKKFISVTLKNTQNNFFVVTYIKNGVMYEKGIKKPKKKWYFVDKINGIKKQIFGNGNKSVKVSETSVYNKNDIRYNDHINPIDYFYLKNDKMPIFGTITSFMPLKVLPPQSIVFTLYRRENMFIISKDYLLDCTDRGTPLKESKITFFHLNDIITPLDEEIICVGSKTPVETFKTHTQQSDFFVNFNTNENIPGQKKPQINFKNFCKNFFKGEKNVFNDIAYEFFFLDIKNYMTFDMTNGGINDRITHFNDGHHDRFISLRSFMLFSSIVKKYIPVCIDIQFITGVRFDRIISGNLSPAADLLVVREALSLGYIIPSPTSTRGQYTRTKTVTKIKRFQKKKRNGFFFIGDGISQICGLDLSSAFASCFCKKNESNSAAVERCYVKLLKPLLHGKNSSATPAPFKLLINTIYGNINKYGSSFIVPDGVLLRAFTDSCKQTMDTLLTKIEKNKRKEPVDLIYGMTDSMYFVAKPKNFEKILTAMTKKLHRMIILKREGPWNFGMIFSFNNYIFQAGLVFNGETDQAKGKFFSSATIPRTIRHFCFKIVNLFFKKKGVKFTRTDFNKLYENHIQSTLKTDLSYSNFMVTTTFSEKNEVHRMVKFRSPGTYVSQKDRVFIITVRVNGFPKHEDLGYAISKGLTIDYPHIYETFKDQVFRFFKNFIVNDVK